MRARVDVTVVVRAAVLVSVSVTVMATAGSLGSFVRLFLWNGYGLCALARRSVGILAVASTVARTLYVLCLF